MNLMHIRSASVCRVAYVLSLGISMMCCSGCDTFRSTRPGFYDDSRDDQVRQQEQVVVSIHKIKDPPDPKLLPQLGPGLVLAGVALSKVVDFASKELQAHLEKVAALHTASFGGTAIATDFNPLGTYELHVTRSVAKSATKRDSVECFFMIYRLEPYNIDTNRVAVVVRPVAKSAVFPAKVSSITCSAARLDDASQPFNTEVLLSFFSVDVADDKASRVQLGDAIKHSLLTTLPYQLPEVPNVDSPGGGPAIGFFLMPSKNSLFEVSVTVTESDPSRAAERNRQLKSDLESITPQVIDYLKSRTGLTEPKK